MSLLTILSFLIWRKFLALQRNEQVNKSLNAGVNISINKFYLQVWQIVKYIFLKYVKKCYIINKRL